MRERADNIRMTIATLKATCEVRMRTDIEHRAFKRTKVDAVARGLPSDHATLLPFD